MKSAKDTIDELKHLNQRELCSKIREMNIDILSDQWICINCGSVQYSEKCSICQLNDYLLPDNELTRQFRESLDIFDNTNPSTFDELDDNF